MALLNYFRQAKLMSAGSSGLTDPPDPLRKILPSTLIEEANKEVATQNAKNNMQQIMARHKPYVIMPKICLI